MWSYTSTNELYHHGVLGMKWGVHRGSSRSSSGSPKRKNGSKKPSAPARKSAKEMTDEELRAKINRKRLENDYNTLYPEKISAGKRLSSGVFNKVILPAATEAGKQIAKEFLVNQGKKALNLPINDKKDNKNGDS